MYQSYGGTDVCYMKKHSMRPKKMIFHVSLLTQRCSDVRAPLPTVVNRQYFRHFSTFFKKKSAAGMWSSASHNAARWNDVYSKPSGWKMAALREKKILLFKFLAMLSGPSPTPLATPSSAPLSSGSYLHQTSKSPPLPSPFRHGILDVCRAFKGGTAVVNVRSRHSLWT